MKSRRKFGQSKLKKERCEICEEGRTASLNFHHIIPKCDPRCTNDNNNLAVVCHTCHDLIHAGEIVIIGVYQSTAGRKLMWHNSQEEPPIPKEFWMVKDNPHVVRRM